MPSPSRPDAAASPHTDPVTAAAINAIRALGMDAVQQANSGHPGAPMGMADMAAALWMRHLRHNPADPAWPGRDRFVLSNGHASMLLYAVLHLSGYALGIEDLKRFRQLHAATPGHPEVGVTPGVETTTGPLGQGLANAVGMALAQALLAAQFNRPGHVIIDYDTYAFAGDGCLMEGISHEVCSLAGTLGLSRLIVLYDDNGISIDGQVQHWFGDDTAARFESYGWQVLRGVDGHDINAVDAAIAQAKIQAQEHGKPVLICCRTVIGKGSPKLAGSEKAHGAPLGEEEIAATRQALGWERPPFDIPEAVYQQWDAKEKGARWQAHWQTRFDAYAQDYPELARELRRRLAGALPEEFDERMQAHIATTVRQAASIASRKASQQTITELAAMLPELLGGSADLTASNLTDWPGAGAVRADDKSGRHINYGVREFGMAAIMNGVALHGGFIPFGGTFLTFSDYSRNALRMAALMKQRVIHVFTHDSIGLGEDGPTHQAVEHAASLRLIPGLHVWRPCDTSEVAVAWQQALLHAHNPSALLLSRQNLPYVVRDVVAVAQIERGGYILRDFPRSDLPRQDNAALRAVIIATGSEVSLALQAREMLAEQGVAVRVVSMPCTQLFDAQPPDWHEHVLPPGVPRVAVEAGATGGWYKYVGMSGENGAVVGLDTYGESAPAAVLFEHFGLTAKTVVARVEKVLGKAA